jgi:hypothetical protein
MGAVLPVLSIVSALVGAGATAYAATQRPRVPSPPAPPKVPNIEDIGKRADDEFDKRRRRAGRAATILTSPRGLTDESVYRPTLLGQ